MAEEKKAKRPLTHAQKEAIARRHRAKLAKQHAERVTKHRIAAEKALGEAERFGGTTEVGYRALQAQLATAHAILALEPAP